jgi:hypothetical protein
MNKIISIVFCLSTIQTIAQSGIQRSFDLDLAIGKTQGNASFAFLHDWHLGKKKKLVLGVGGRVNAYLARNQYYLTAPAKLTSGKTGIGVIFTENLTENIDTFLIAKPNVYSVNALINLGYRLTDMLAVGFNIDAIGFSFGANKNGNYINGSQGQSEKAKPTEFNLLLTSDNDRGSLNSELYGRYSMTDQWSVRAGLQFLFTEYTTQTNVQQYPEPNNRFRNKSLMIMIGTSLKLN